MQNNISQIYVFITCISLGGAGCFIYTFFNCFKVAVKSKTLKIIIDVAFSLLFSILWCYLSHAFNFGNFRGYMLLGLVAGWYIWLKSVNYYLQKPCKWFIIGITKLKNGVVCNDRRKGKKNDIRRNGGRGIVDNNIGCSNGLPTSCNKKQKA